LNNCPFLGQEDDPQTHTDFSSSRNYCYRTEKPTPILLESQQSYCLTKDYPNCPIYQDISHLTLPIGVSSDKWVEPDRPISKLVWTAFVVFFLLGVLVISWFIKPNLFLSKRLEPTPIPISKSSIPLAETSLTDIVPTPTLVLTSTLHPSATATSTETPTAIPFTPVPLGLGTPSKTIPQLLIHRIAQGDSLALLASRFGTSVAAIQSVNYFLPVPLWEGVLVVIPINTIDVSDLPAFEPYQIKERSMSLSDAALALNTTPELLSRYNPMDPNTILVKDSWLIIPRPFPPPTGLPLATADGKIQNYGE
jgi:LysM repeat protein